MAIENTEMNYSRPQTVSLTQRNLDKSWKTLEADPELVEEIKGCGFVNPLPVVKTVGCGIDMEFVVVEGSERLRAAQEAGLKEVWCFFVEGTEEVEDEDEVEEIADDKEDSVEVVATTSEMQATPVQQQQTQTTGGFKRQPTSKQRKTEQEINVKRILCAQYVNGNYNPIFYRVEKISGEFTTLQEIGCELVNREELSSATQRRISPQEDIYTPDETTLRGKPFRRKIRSSHTDGRITCRINDYLYAEEMVGDSRIVTGLDTQFA